MVLINFLFFISNVLLLVFGFLYIKKKTEKLVVNKEILSDIKKEVNSMIIRLNETTVNNINLVEDKARSLEKLIKLAGRIGGGLDEKMSGYSGEEADRLSGMTYNPQKIAKQSIETVEKMIKVEEKKADELKTAEETVKDMPINEKVMYLLNEGFSADDIRKKYGLSSGELELIMNLES